MSDWIKINDEKVIHVWIDDVLNEEVHVSPNYYQDNGEPCDDCGDVLRYSHTLIKN
jgi:hypothetical protein